MNETTHEWNTRLSGIVQHRAPLWSPEQSWSLFVHRYLAASLFWCIGPVTRLYIYHSGETRTLSRMVYGWLRKICLFWHVCGFNQFSFPSTVIVSRRKWRCLIQFPYITGCHLTIVVRCYWCTVIVSTQAESTPLVRFPYTCSIQFPRHQPK